MNWQEEPKTEETTHASSTGAGAAPDGLPIKSRVTPVGVRWCNHLASAAFRRLRHVRQLLASPCLHVVELGCQDGWLASYGVRAAAREDWPIQWCGFDTRPDLIERAQRRAVQATFVLCDPASLDRLLPKHADVVLVNWWSLAAPAPCWSTLFRCLHRLQPTWLCVFDWDRSRMGRWSRIWMRGIGAGGGTDASFPSAEELCESLKGAGFHGLIRSPLWPSAVFLDAICGHVAPVTSSQPPDEFPMPALARGRVALVRHLPRQPVVEGRSCQFCGQSGRKTLHLSNSDNPVFFWEFHGLGCDLSCVGNVTSETIRRPDCPAVV